MIVVRVELWSAITHQKTTLALMSICNEGTSLNPNRSDYEVKAHRGRDEDALMKSLRSGSATHKGHVTNHARLQEHIWVLVTKALLACGYGR